MTGHKDHPAETDVTTGHHVESSHEAHPDASLDPAGTDVGMIALVGVAGSIILFVTILACIAVFYAVQQDRTEAMQTSRPPMVREYQQQQNALLENTWWVNKEQGTVTIPVDRAMEIVAEEGLQSR